MQPGTIIGGDFKIVRPLSAGGMGSVFVAEQLSTGRQRALKLMHPELVVNPQMRARFEREAKISASIESEHVVEVTTAGVCATTGAPYIAMELLAGEDLAHFLARRGAMPPEEALAMLAQLCHGLGAAHAQQIVHRDLKPDNVFIAKSRRIGGDYQLKILDFGIAKLLGAQTQNATQSMGTPLWMAPEQADPNGRVTPMTDVWALGLIVFQMLSGIIYWDTAALPQPTAVMLLREVLIEPLEPATARAAKRGCRTKLPLGFDTWFARCVVRDAAHRFANAAQAFDALVPILKAREAPPMSRPPPQPASSRYAHDVSAHDVSAHDAGERRSRADHAFQELQRSPAQWVEPEPESVDDDVLEEVDDEPEELSEGDLELASARSHFAEAPRVPQRARELLQLARKHGDFDLAWRVAAMLVQFRVATQEEAAIASAPPKAGLPTKIDERRFRLFLTDDLPQPVVGVVRAIGPPLARAGELTRDGSQESGSVLRRGENHPLVAAIFGVVDQLRLPDPRVLVRSVAPAPIHIQPGRVPTCIVSQSAFAILSPVAAKFTAARWLARLRPELFALFCLESPDDARVLLTAAAHAAGAGQPSTEAVGKMTRLLAMDLSPAEKLALIRSVNALHAAGSVPLAKLMRGAHVAAARIALAISGDLQHACREVMRVPPPSEVVTVDALTDELIVFWVSDELTRLRSGG